MSADHDHSNPLPETRFQDVWLYCMLDHQVGTLPGGPCFTCVRDYAISGPPDGRWNSVYSPRKAEAEPS